LECQKRLKGHQQKSEKATKNKVMIITYLYLSHDL